MEILVYPGSFDPVTFGHVDIIKRASQFCEKLIVAVLKNPSKQSAFSLDERVRMIEICVKDIGNVNVESFDGLLADFVRRSGSKAIIKGLRAVSDYEYELQMAHINKKLNPDMETLFMMASAQYSFLSSSTIKDIVRFGGDVSEFIPGEILDIVYNKIRRV